MFAIRLDSTLEEELNRLAEAKGSNRSAIVREAIVRYLEDNEDLNLARRALDEGGQQKSLAEIREAFGLDR